MVKLVVGIHYEKLPACSEFLFILLERQRWTTAINFGCATIHLGLGQVKPTSQKLNLDLLRIQVLEDSQHPPGVYPQEARIGSGASTGTHAFHYGIQLS